MAPPVPLPWHHDGFIKPSLHKAFSLIINMFRLFYVLKLLYWHYKDIFPGCLSVYNYRTQLHILSETGRFTKADHYWRCSSLTICFVFVLFLGPVWVWSLLFFSFFFSFTLWFSYVFSPRLQQVMVYLRAQSPDNYLLPITPDVHCFLKKIFIIWVELVSET